MSIMAHHIYTIRYVVEVGKKYDWKQKCIHVCRPTASTNRQILVRTETETNYEKNYLRQRWKM